MVKINIHHAYYLQPFFPICVPLHLNKQKKTHTQTNIILYEAGMLYNINNIITCFIYNSSNIVKYGDLKKNQFMTLKF